MLFYLIPGILAVIFCFLNPYSGGADALLLVCLVISLFYYIGTSKKANTFISKHMNYETTEEERQSQIYNTTKMCRFIAYTFLIIGVIYAGISTFLLSTPIDGVPFIFAESMFGAGCVASIACSVMMAGAFDKICVKEASSIRSAEDAKAILEQNRRFSTNGVSLGPAPDKKNKNETIETNTDNKNTDIDTAANDNTTVLNNDADNSNNSSISDSTLSVKQTKTSTSKKKDFKINTSNTTKKVSKISKQRDRISMDIAADITSRMLGCDKEEVLKNGTSLSECDGFLFTTKDGKRKVAVGANGKTAVGDNSTSVEDLIKKL